MSKDFDKTDNSSFDDVSVTQSTFMHAVERRHSDVLVGIFNLIDAVAKQAKGGFFISNEQNQQWYQENHKGLSIVIDEASRSLIVDYLKLKGYTVTDSDKWGLYVSWTEGPIPESLDEGQEEEDEGFEGLGSLFG